MNNSSKIFLKRIICACAVLVVACLGVRCGLTGGYGEYIGEFDMSHYCLEKVSGYHICGNSEYGCGGDKLVPGHSVAVPKSVLEKYPVGTRVIAVYPDGSRSRLIIHDTGQALERLNRIDMPVKTHREALKLGVIKNVRLYAEK